MFRVDLDNKRLIPLRDTSLKSLELHERFDLQEWIENSPQILGEDLLVIAKELELSPGARLDLLALDRSGNLVVIELKRDGSGREVDWQAVRYSSYVSSFTEEEIFNLFADYIGEGREHVEDLLIDFVNGDIDQLNKTQRIILCARDFHSDVVSAVMWLRDYGVDVSCIRIKSCVDGDGQLFMSPETIIPLPEAKDYIVRKERKEKERKEKPPWSGYYFVNAADDDARNWDDCVRYGFIAAGGGPKYSRPLYNLEVGAHIFAYVKGRGYVGYGEVTRPACPIFDFEVNGTKLLDLDLQSVGSDHDRDDLDRCEHVVGVRWYKTFSRENARTFNGVFANQNIVCKLRHPETVAFVEREFGLKPDL